MGRTTRLRSDGVRRRWSVAAGFVVVSRVRTPNVGGLGWRERRRLRVERGEPVVGVHGDVVTVTELEGDRCVSRVRPAARGAFAVLRMRVETSARDRR